jgi:bacterioferritin (cytochrome b1)
MNSSRISIRPISRLLSREDENRHLQAVRSPEVRFTCGLLPEDKKTERRQEDLLVENRELMKNMKYLKEEISRIRNETRQAAYDLASEFNSKQAKLTKSMQEMTHRAELACVVLRHIAS